MALPLCAQGHWLGAGQETCPHCGTAAVAGPPAAPPVVPPPVFAPIAAEPTRGPNRLATIGAGVALLIGIVAAVIIWVDPSHESGSAAPQLNEDISDAADPGIGEREQIQVDLISTATAEGKFLTDYRRYTNSVADLQAESLRLHPGTDIAVGTGPLQGFCVVASYAGRGNWYLFDSTGVAHSGDTFADFGQAEHACSIADVLFSTPTMPEPLTNVTAPAVTTAPVTNQDQQVQSDLRNAATAEETYLTDTDRYTDVVSDLEREGYRSVSGTEIAIAVAGNDSYCLVGSAGGLGHWWLYDSFNFGLSKAPFATQREAEAACSFPGAQFSASTFG